MQGTSKAIETQAPGAQSFQNCSEVNFDYAMYDTGCTSVIYFANDALLDVAKPFDFGSETAPLGPFDFEGKTAGADMLLVGAERFVALVAYDVTLDFAPPDLPIEPRD